MAPLIIDVTVRDQITRLVEYADAHRFSRRQLRDQVEGVPGVKQVGEQPEYVVEVPVGFRCVFSIEDQPVPMGWSRHLSVSIATPGKLPHPLAVAALMPLFGFSQQFVKHLTRLALGDKSGERMEWCTVYPQGRAINVIERLWEVE